MLYENMQSISILYMYFCKVCKMYIQPYKYFSWRFFFFSKCTVCAKKKKKPYIFFISTVTTSRITGVHAWLQNFRARGIHIPAINKHP